MRNFLFIHVACLAVLVAPAAAAGIEEGKLAVRLLPSENPLTGQGRFSSIGYSPAADELYVVDALSGHILVGKAGWTRFVKLETLEEVKAYAVAVGSGGDLYVTSTRGRQVTRLDPAGRIVARIEIPGGEKDLPLGRIRQAPSGKLYAVERAGRRLFILDESLAGCETLSLDGSPDTLALVDVSIDADGAILALSSRGQVVRRYDGQGRYLGGFGLHGPSPADFSFPSSFLVRDPGTLWIVDTLQHSMKVCTRKGEFLGSLLTMGTGAESLFFPVDVALMGQSKAAVLDKGTRSVKFFDVLTGGRGQNEKME